VKCPSPVTKKVRVISGQVRQRSRREHVCALRCSVKAAHLSPRLSVIDLIEAISGHFPPYVQRAMLSANVRSIQEALSFLNKLEVMETGDGNRESNHGT
jgi:hypothetical protein